ncbi:chemotaxis response regulator protein-glutamate methylesterase [Caenispirillum salinarum]|uniref:protein-glutamate methylesterase/protein-glutamine glutaminase n=1 Tax=Caenispirillum salinarum TaxID=859058 RepID=UPI00384DAD7D
MVVDDSAVVRGLETRILESDPAITVIASVGNGQAAVQALDRHDVEVIVLDIEMPVMDGITALPLLLKKAPNVKIVMSSTLTLRNAEISMKALEAGASEYVTKPSSSRELTGGQDFKAELVAKVKALGAAARKASGGTPRVASPAPRAAAAPAATPRSAGQPSLHQAGANIVLREPSKERPDIIAIGSSTGGPQALFNLLGGLRKCGGVQQPIIITQHMPATFTTILAEHINRLAGLTAKEAENGEVLKPGVVYIAPGDYHMLVESKGTNRVLTLNQAPPENFCRPSVDPMFRSVAKVYGRRALAVVLTGMGADGAKGGKIIADAGGTVVAQDEATSVVWGMPGATAQGGACSAVLPLPDIAPYLHKIANRRV